MALTAPSISRKTALQTNPEPELPVPLIGKRDDVRRLRLANPHWSLGDIASETGLTRERVRQILVAESLPTRRETPRTVIDRALESMPAPAPSANPTPTAHDDQPESEKNGEPETLTDTLRSPFEGSEGAGDV